jgi:hypothetical protein
MYKTNIPTPRYTGAGTGLISAYMLRDICTVKMLTFCRTGAYNLGGTGKPRKQGNLKPVRVTPQPNHIKKNKITD